MALEHEDIWNLLGITRSKFRKIRLLHPVEKQRNYNAREVFAFKILLVFVNHHVPGMVSMHEIRTDQFFKDICELSHVDLKKSIALWNKSKKTLKVINKKEKYDRSNYHILPLPLKNLYKEYLLHMAEIGCPIPTGKSKPELDVLRGGKG